MHEPLPGLPTVGVGFKKFKLPSRTIEDGLSCFLAHTHTELVFSRREWIVRFYLVFVAFQHRNSAKIFSFACFIFVLVLTDNLSS